MKVFFVSLGCDKNLVDSEKMLSLVAKEGFELTDDESVAEIIIINTCCFIHDAKEESIETIIEMGQWKQKGQCKALIVAGCLAQRYHKEIQEELPEVDGIVGTTAFDQIVPVIRDVLAGQKEECLKDIDYMPVNLTGRLSSMGNFTSYLKIAEGCNKCCSYCIIPKLRGHYRSVMMEELLQEANELAQAGTVELILVAQETTLYGVDLYGEKMLPKLLKELCKIEKLEMIRILYCYPEEITKEFIQVIKEEPKICHYLDMPIQHCSDRILKKMGRRTNRKELTEKISMIRKEIPDICLRTSLITGFPTETEEEVEELLDFVKEIRFNRLGVFTYSPEEDTPAAMMDGQIDEQVKQERKERIMEAQQEIAFAYNDEKVGSCQLVLVEGEIPEDNVYVGRTYMDAPNVDGCIFIEGSGELLSGTIVKAQVTDANGYDLLGILMDE